MRRKLFVLAFASLATLAYAQERQNLNIENSVKQEKYQVLTNPFCDNWFISAGLGAEVTLGDFDSSGKFGQRISPTFNVSVGKWFTPGLALRMQYSGLQSRGFNPNQSSYTYGEMQDNGLYRQKFNYMNFHLDAMFNLAGMIAGYDANRVYEAIPYVGFGLIHNYTAPHATGLSFNAGLINRFRINDKLDVNLEISALGTEEKFDGKWGNQEKVGYDGVVSVTAGITYRIPNRFFNRPKPQLVTEEELKDMRGRMNELAAYKAELEQKLAEVTSEAQQQPKVVEKKVPVDAPRTLFFEIGSSRLSVRERMNLKYMAQQMQEAPDMQYRIIGYADSATGSVDYNETLSRKRAEAVVKVLVEDYGIDASRLHAEGAGGVDNFGQALLNRVVLIQLKK